ncbi:alpha/beta fold hydrolase [Alteromonas pelagimontana]|uniref:Alpha/beta fold hydrolase n=1 Tax=Alteromonas pelagimontana TaxID=1858656 RepID=A0A6M4MAM8_9ALTE|nr:alpha/beta fold hydrolase [Alteromonas pelagimontana]QJR79720.1 alpha/beta fold hydrolase [Alteromonas pelagimontana]
MAHRIAIVLATLFTLASCATFVAREIESSSNPYTFSTSESFEKLAETLLTFDKQYCSDTWLYCFSYFYGAPQPLSESDLSFSVSLTNPATMTFDKSLTLISSAVPRFEGTVMLLHGFGADKEEMRYAATYFQLLGFHVLVPGLFGRDAASPPLSYGVKDAELLTEFLDNQRDTVTQPLIVVGHSMGALAAVKTATLSNQISGLILLSPMNRFDIATVGVAMSFRPWTSLLIPDFSLKEGAKIALSNAGVDIEQTDMFDDLSSLTLPILVYGGRKDTISNINEAAQWNMPNVTRHVVKSENHMSTPVIDNLEHRAISTWISANIEPAVYLNTGDISEYNQTDSFEEK